MNRGHIPLIVRLAIASLEESKGTAEVVFLLFGPSSFFTIAYGNVGNSRVVTAGPGYESIPQPRDGYEETFGSGPSWKRNACSDVVLRGLGSKGCGVFPASGSVE